MAFNGTGTFVRIYNWVVDKGNSTPITASRMDAEMDGMATGLSNCVTKDGQTTLTANIPMNSFKFTGLGVGNARTNSLTLGQVQDGQFTALGTTGGAADAYTATPSPAITAYVATMRYSAKINATNLTTTPTLAISGLTAGTIKKFNNSGTEIAVEASDLIAGVIYDFMRNPANDAWIVLNPNKPYLGSINFTTLPTTIQIFTASGTWTRPANCKAYEAWVVGGGGGSGGAQPGANMGEASGGGGGGGCAYKFNTSPNSSETVTIGVGGTAGTTTGNGGDGGTSSLGAVCSATGGKGSINASGSNSTFSGGGGGAGGTGSNGTINIIGSAGQNGSRSYSVTGLSGNGGSGAGQFGGGGAIQAHVSSATGVAGVAATANTGGGAAGACADYNSGSARAGAAGGSGIIVIKEYY